MSRSCRRQRSRSRETPGQLSLPLDYSRSEPASPPRNPSQWNGKRAQRRLARFATSPTIPAQPDIVPVSSKKDNIVKILCQRHPFRLTSSISSIIDNVIQNGLRSNVSALPPFTCRTFAKPSESRPHVWRGSPRRFPANPLDRYQRRASLPALPLQCYL
jgi:hypothetical protein